MEVKITTLIENQPSLNPELHFEHGLSLYIEIDGKKILFDTGQSGNFVQNAEILQKELQNLDYVLVSHGHFDHANGVPKLLDILGNDIEMIVGEEFFRKKYKRLEDGTYYYGGVSFQESDITDKGIQLRKIREGTYYLSEHIMVFHHFKRTNDVELPNPIFVVKEGDGYILDEFPDEIAMGIITDKGLVVIVGCSHVGIVNILTDIKERTNMPIYAVIGGTHLVEADQKRVYYTIDKFREMNIKMVAVSHCTGEDAIHIMNDSFKENFINNNTGNVITIQLQDERFPLGNLA